MRIRHLLTAAVVTLAASGAYGQKTVKVDFQASQARFLETSPSAYMKPLVAEVVVDQAKGRIRDNWTLDALELSSKTIDGNPQATLLNLKSYALFKSAEKHDCDMIIVPTFDIHITNTGATISVAGYPANFAKWTTGTTADYDWILLERGEQRITPDNSTMK